MGLVVGLALGFVLGVLSVALFRSFGGRWGFGEYGSLSVALPVRFVL